MQQVHGPVKGLLTSLVPVVDHFDLIGTQIK